MVVVCLIAGVVSFVGGFANAIYWKRHPRGYVPAANLLLVGLIGEPS